MVGELRPSAPDSRVRKAPNRQSRSCKCDRVKPCHACCAHGYPSKCVYENIPDEEARPITQAEEIRNLRAEIRELRTKVDERRDGSGDQELERLDQLEGLFDSIRSAPSSVVDQLVREIRSAHGGVKRSLVKVGPWEGHEAYEGYDYTGGLRRSVIPIRRSTRDSSWEVNFNDPLEDEEDENGELSERMSLSSGSESGSSGTISVMSMQRPAVDIFVERFVDAFSPEVDSKSGRAGALRAAAEIRMFSPLISDAFEAVSVAFFGRSVQNKEIEASGFRLYPRVLRGLQDALIDPERSKSEATLVTVTLLLAFESVERTTHSGVPAHVRGAVRLIEHRGPENHMYGVEHLLFTELRPYWIGGAMATRQPSFLAREEWKTIPWSAGTTTKDILHHLLDLAAEVPALLAQSDQFQEAQESSVMGAQEMTVKQTAIWNGITDLTGRFYQWHQDWVECYPDGPPQEAEQKGEQGFPIFRRRDLRTGAVYAATKLTYPNLLLAQTMCVYYAVRLILSSIDTRPVDRVSLMEKYELGCGICRTYEYYILTAPGNMINRLAFPTRVAWEAFPDGGPERAFMAEVLSLVEKRHSLGLWGGNMSELSTHKDSPLNTDQT
ncbi:transcriptional regulator family: Fungal Specific TF [Penicillium malachiteum]|uniref:transcriptional regulator family: Fungal Specific TF n=1 Tax=Penicillium malachiteum TaxID=1324776 RepID=UPI002547CEC3|nr:transcriptional regulator family: Fungal Specific TF [Penicillium malachiteum]KAJ5735995.1 transcriptional regulator family: Fungal Specific TF [Penicillium malachiteum]